MAVEKNNKVDNVKQRIIVLVGIKIDESGKEILKWALEAVARKHGECVVVVIHVCSTFREFFFSFFSLLSFYIGF